MKIRLAGYHSLDWLDALEGCEVGEPADVSLWNPAAPRPSRGFTVMYLDVREDDHLVRHPDAVHHVGSRADAYAGTARAVGEAIEWFRAGAPRPTRGAVYLGSLGTHALAIPIGTPAEIGERMVFGRGRSCDLILRHGAHSDQNVCARKHALVERTDAGIVVTDLRSTNGTYVDGALIDAPTVARPSTEVAFAGYFRFLICG